MGMSYFELTQSLADAFNALADEAQSLNDRRVVLEHKLRFAHEQVRPCINALSPRVLAYPSPSYTAVTAYAPLPRWFFPGTPAVIP